LKIVYIEKPVRRGEQVFLFLMEQVEAKKAKK